jgi:riboflavin kinase/FMN adenylyltransferase
MSMRIVYDAKNTPKGHVLALGNFDGVHLGHKAIIKKTIYLARQNGIKPAVITFEPHPVHLFAPNKLPIRLTSLRGKLRLLEELGVEVCYVLKFNKALAALSAEGFINNYLAGNMVVTGYDFSFGAGRTGSTQTLKDAFGDNYFCMPPQDLNGVVYSSSKIRTALKMGDVATAKLLLGHNYFVEGRIMHGAGQGKKLGFATANIKLKPYLLKPKYGVYAVQTNFGRGIANFGVRPTLDGLTEVFEVHLLGFEGNIYGQMMQVELTKFIRPEMKFENIEALKKQIADDIKHL